MEEPEFFHGGQQCGSITIQIMYYYIYVTGTSCFIFIYFKYSIYFCPMSLMELTTVGW